MDQTKKQQLEGNAALIAYYTDKGNLQQQKTLEDAGLEMIKTELFDDPESVVVISKIYTKCKSMLLRIAQLAEKVNPPAIPQKVQQTTQESSLVADIISVLVKHGYTVTYPSNGTKTVTTQTEATTKETPVKEVNAKEAPLARLESITKAAELLNVLKEEKLLKGLSFTARLDAALKLVGPNAEALINNVKASLTKHILSGVMANVLTIAHNNKLTATEVAEFANLLFATKDVKFFESLIARTKQAPTAEMISVMEVYIPDIKEAPAKYKVAEALDIFSQWTKLWKAPQQTPKNEDALEIENEVDIIARQKEKSKDKAPKTEAANKKVTEITSKMSNIEDLI